MAYLDFYFYNYINIDIVLLLNLDCHKMSDLMEIKINQPFLIHTSSYISHYDHEESD